MLYAQVNIIPITDLQTIAILCKIKKKTFPIIFKFLGRIAL